MKPLEIILTGGGGHCKSCIDVIEKEGKYLIRGILDFPEKKPNTILGYPVIGNDDDIPKFAKDNGNFLITLGNMGLAFRRDTIFDFITKSGGNLPVIKSPLAHISNHSFIDRGSIIMHHALVNADSKIGKNCIINSKALIEHDTIVGNNCHVSTGSIINGTCQIGDNCFIGSSAVIFQGITIGPNTIISAGAVVNKNISKPGVYAGTPAKRIKSWEKQ